MEPPVPARHFNISTFFAGFGSFSFILSIPIFLNQQGYDFLHIGVVLSSYSIAILIFSPLWGYFSDKTGRRKPFLIAGYLVFALGGFLFPLADSLPQLMAVRFLQGVGLAAHPMLTALFSDYYGKDATKRFGRLSGSEAFGWGVGGLVAGFLADAVGLPEAFSLLAFLPLISAALVWWKLPEAESETADDAALTAPVKFPKKLFFLYGTVFIRMSSAIALWSLMPIYLQQFVNSMTLVGVVTASNMLIQPFFMILIGNYAERLGRLRLVIWGILGTIGTFWLYGSADNLVPIVIGQATISLSWAAIVIGMNTYIMTTAPKGTRGKAFGYLTGSITSAMAVGPMLGTSLAEALSVRGMIFAVSASMLFSLPFVVYLRMRDQRTKTMPPSAARRSKRFF